MATCKKSHIKTLSACLVSSTSLRVSNWGGGGGGGGGCYTELGRGASLMSGSSPPLMSLLPVSSREEAGGKTTGAPR